VYNVGAYHFKLRTALDSDKRKPSAEVEQTIHLTVKFSDVVTRRQTRVIMRCKKPQAAQSGALAAHRPADERLHDRNDYITGREISATSCADMRTDSGKIDVWRVAFVSQLPMHVCLSVCIHRNSSEAEGWTIYLAAVSLKRRQRCANKQLSLLRREFKYTDRRTEF
jgi:hypothetical protein